jgi:hypothetical protein
VDAAIKMLEKIQTGEVASATQGETFQHGIKFAPTLKHRKEDTENSVRTRKSLSRISVK